MKYKMTKAERKEQRERVEESMEHMVALLRISICVVAKSGEKMRTALDVYDRAVAHTKGIKYHVDNDMYFGGFEKRRERAERRRGK